MDGTNTSSSTADRSSSKVTFRGAPDFFQTLRARVDAHFAGAPRRDDPRLYRKAALILVWFLGAYATALFSRRWPLQLAACVAYALAACALGFNVFHDAIHCSFSESRGVNLALARVSCTLLGAGRKFWWYKHNVLHHRFTNIHEWDDDLETRGSLRMSPEQAWEPKFRYQHVYFPFLYSLTTIEWLFAKDFVQYFTLRMNPYQTIPELSRAEKFEFWTSKAIWALAFVVLPFAVLPWWKALAGLAIFHLTLGLALALIFNLAHAMERAEFPVPEPGPSIEEEWAAHQLRTTVNFATGNGPLTWFAGGLNFQVEHHLFPQVSHTHYPALSRIVSRTAGEFGLPYNDYPTYFSALKSHWNTLRRLAQPPL
jgi:linoleoyl-CoA desaturase